MEESCSGKKRRKGDPHQRPEQMSEMAAAGISGIIDPEVLDCAICFDPLRPPVFQVSHPSIVASLHLHLPYSFSIVVLVPLQSLNWN